MLDSGYNAMLDFHCQISAKLFSKYFAEKSNWKKVNWKFLRKIYSRFQQPLLTYLILMPQKFELTRNFAEITLWIWWLKSFKNSSSTFIPCYVDGCLYWIYLIDLKATNRHLRTIKFLLIMARCLFKLILLFLAIQTEKSFPFFDVKVLVLMNKLLNWRTQVDLWQNQAVVSQVPTHNTEI